MPEQPASTYLPATMTVRIRDRAREAPWGSGPTNPVIRRVTITATCPTFGCPRGEPANLYQHDDGVTYYVDVWTNPCGHVDHYSAVAREADRLGYPAVREPTAS